MQQVTYVQEHILTATVFYKLLLQCSQKLFLH